MPNTCNICSIPKPENYKQYPFNQKYFNESIILSRKTTNIITTEIIYEFKSFNIRKYTTKNTKYFLLK